jgi:hypothetical protein
MSQQVEDRIKELPTLKRAALVLLWHDLFGGPAPAKMRRELMIPILAYRTQEKAHGGLKPATRARLRKLAQALEKDPAANLAAAPQIKPGTRLLREWRGDMHEVIAEERGYEYRGKRFESLSEIARQITGTRWSGPLFFGLRGPQPQGNGLDGAGRA